MAESIKKDTVRSIKWASIEKFSLQGIQFVIGIILARLLTPDDYGAIGMLTIFISVSQTFVDSGFTSALIRKIDRTENDLSTAFIVNLSISVLAVIVLCVLAPYIASFYNMPILCQILRVQSVTLVIYALMAVQVTKLTIELNFRAIAKCSIISSLSSGLIGIALAYNGFGVWSLVLQNLLSVFINLCCVIWFCRWYPNKGFSKESYRDLFSFGKNILGASILYSIYDNMTSLVIGKFFSSQSLGMYSRGTSLAALPVNSVNGILNKVTYPIFSTLQNDTARLISSYRKYIQLSSMIIFFGCCLIASIGNPIVIFLLTDKWSEAVIYLQIYSFAIILDHINAINLNLIKIKGRSDLILRLEIIKRIVSFSILIAAIPFGVVGICVSKIIYSYIAVLINTYYNGKLFNMGITLQFRDFVKYFIWSLIAVLPAYVLTFTNFPNIVQICLGVAVSVCIYCMALRKDANFLEVKQMIMSKIHKI